MRAIAIDSRARTITEIELDVSKGSLEPLQKAVGGYIEAAYTYPNGDDLFVNEEGLLNIGEDATFFDIGAHQPFIGNGIIVGHNAEGETIAAVSKVTDIKVAFLTLAQVRAQHFGMP